MKLTNYPSKDVDTLDMNQKSVCFWMNQILILSWIIKSDLVSSFTHPHVYLQSSLSTIKPRAVFVTVMMCVL